jgi:hypothetical protein
MTEHDRKVKAMAMAKEGKGSSRLVALWVSLLCCAAWPALAAASGTATGPGADHAQLRLSQELGLGRMSPQSGPDCTGGIRYDDGGFEDAVSVPVSNGLEVMSFDLPANASGVQQVCVPLTRTSGATSTDLSFNVVFYAADGPGGSPGTPLASIPATATAVPLTSSNTINSQYYPVPIGAALTLPAARSLYVGVQFDGLQHFFVGVDNSPTTPYRPSFASTDGGATWQAESAIDANAFSAFGIRLDPILSQTACVPSATAMCLQGSRFKVEATWKTPDGTTGSAQTVQLTDDSGYLWFFAAANIESVVKVLDACALNHRFWVFAGGLTNVQVVLKVTDTQTGVAKSYTNPLNTPFQPLQDTNALACP